MNQETLESLATADGLRNELMPFLAKHTNRTVVMALAAILCETLIELGSSEKNACDLALDIVNAYKKLDEK